jgi:hypothetical protein
MNSSTSSSEPLIDRRVLLGVLLVLAALELFTRVRLFDMSKDFRRFRGYDARAAALMRAPGPRIALFGNSATDRGVDRATLERALAGAGMPATTALFVADQSRVDTWRFMLERYLARPGRRPELVVITFYEDDLADGNRVEIGRLAQFFTTVRDWPEVFAVDLPNAGDRVDFVLSSFWATYAAADRIRERLLETLVPGFQGYSQSINEVAYRHQQRRAAEPPASPRPPTYAALDRLLARAASAGLRLCFVAYPTRVDGDGQPYQLPPDLLDRLRRAAAAFVDLRRLPVLRPELYADEVHLTEAGRIPYSQALGRALARAARPDSLTATLQPSPR